jgi:RNA polymerase sigma-70 factor (ECF subfamily)
MYSLARWLTRRGSAAEDLVQDTVVRALRAAHQFQPGTNLRAWLFQIMRNLFFSQQERRRLEPESMDPEQLSRVSGGAAVRRGSDSGGGPGDRGLGLDLEEALACLPEESRTVMWLADVEDFTMGEIAEILGCPVGTVKSRLFRARLLLREQLRDYAPVRGTDRHDDLR